MKKIYIAFLVSFLFAGVAYADGGFLDVLVMVSNDHGGTIKPADFSYTVNYDSTSISLSGLFGYEGGQQAFDFPNHIMGNGPLNYSVTPNSKRGYSITKSDNCTGQLPDNTLRIANCTIYAVDDGYPLPVQPTESVSVGTTTPTTITIGPADDPQVVALKEQLVTLMNILIDLLNQLIALKK